MIGPLTIAPGGFNHVLVAVDKFTKWIEYNPLSRSHQIEQWISSLTLYTGVDDRLEGVPARPYISRGTGLHGKS